MPNKLHGEPIVLNDAKMRAPAGTARDLNRSEVLEDVQSPICCATSWYLLKKEEKIASFWKRTIKLM